MQSPIQNPKSAITWVFVHGAGSSRDFWIGQQDAFPKGVALDLPGHGGTRRTHALIAPTAAPPLPTITIPAYADWVSAQIEAAGWPSVVLVGHSMGGAIALTLGLRHPPWLRGLVLANSGAGDLVSPAVLELVEHDYPAAVAWVVDHSLAAHPSPYRREGVRRQMLRLAPAVVQDDYRACAVFEVREALQGGGVMLPTLVIGGTEDQIVLAAYSEFLADNIPQATRAWVGNAGHMAPLEQPASWNMAALAWAERLAPAG
jgi:pimeloyl-ACP methyl ester carboxylesterase